MNKITKVKSALKRRFIFKVAVLLRNDSMSSATLGRHTATPSEGMRDLRLEVGPQGSHKSTQSKYEIFYRSGRSWLLLGRTYERSGHRLMGNRCARRQSTIPEGFCAHSSGVTARGVMVHSKAENLRPYEKFATRHQIISPNITFTSI